MNESNFTKGERRVIKAMYGLDRWATKNEIAEYAEMSWNTADTALNKLRRKRLVDIKRMNGRVHWRIKDVYM